MGHHSITRTGFARFLATGATFFGSATAAQAAAKPGAEKMHRVAIHVDQNDPAIMNLALNNATNFATYFSGIAQEFVIEIVTYGPGLHMLRVDTSPVKDRLASIKQSIPNITFSACGVTKTGMEKSEGHPIGIVPQATVVPSGAVRLVELQEQNWSYLKP